MDSTLLLGFGIIVLNIALLLNFNLQRLQMLQWPLRVQFFLSLVHDDLVILLQGGSWCNLVQSQSQRFILILLMCVLMNSQLYWLNLIWAHKGLPISFFERKLWRITRTVIANLLFVTNNILILVVYELGQFLDLLQTLFRDLINLSFQLLLRYFPSILFTLVAAASKCSRLFGRNL